MMRTIRVGMRRKVNAKYMEQRALGVGVDTSISDAHLVGFLLRKLAHRVRGFSRGKRNAYFGSSVNIRARSNLVIGESVSVGSHVLLDAMGGQGITLGDSVTIDSFSQLRVSGVVRHAGVGIFIGDRSAVGAYNCILGQGGIEIGSDVLIGPNVTILSENHNYSLPDVPIRSQSETRDETTIGDGVWIGAGVVVLAGSNVGAGSILAAGAVVRGEIAPNSIVGGVPARIIGIR